MKKTHIVIEVIDGQVVETRLPKQEGAEVIMYEEKKDV